MKKIVIIDDNKPLLFYLERHIRKAGHAVEIAQSGLEAVEKLAVYPADVIFVDYFLPHLNADHLCRIIRRMEHLKSAYLVVMSAAATELELDLKKLDANALIAKGSFEETAGHLIAAIGDAEEATPVDAESTKVMGIDSVFPRRMTKELLDQNRQLTAILDSISEGLIVILNERVVYANPAVESMLGLARDTLLASRLPDFFDAYPRVQIEALVKPEPASDAASPRSQTLRFGDRTIWIKRIPFQGDDDATILLATDVTEQIKAKQALQKYQRHLEALVKERTADLESANEKLRQVQKMEAAGVIAGAVAHDLNNMLSGIVSYPDLMLLELPENSPLREPMRTMKKTGEKAAAIVQDMLALARRGILSEEVLNLNALLSGYLKSPDSRRLKSHHPDVQVALHLENDLQNITGSPVHLSKLIANLVSNAAEAMQGGGKISIVTENREFDSDWTGYEEVKAGQYVTLSVTDEGVGITQPDMARIFEPFYTKKVMGRSGTGLGMAVVWGTVKDHNGYIDIHSTQGKGTTFTLYFPATGEAQPEAEGPVAIESYMGKGESILVVDNSEEQREIASALLRKLEYRVEAVATGEDAVAFLQQNPVDLVVLDMMMGPGIDGLETYRRIVARTPGQKALFAIGYSEKRQIREAGRLGAGRFVKKPYTLEKIGLAIRKELDAKDAS